MSLRHLHNIIKYDLIVCITFILQRPRQYLENISEGEHNIKTYEQIIKII